MNIVISCFILFLIALTPFLLWHDKRQREKEERYIRVLPGWEQPSRPGVEFVLLLRAWSR